MNVEYNFSKNTVSFDSGETYDLDHLRSYIVGFHNSRLKDYFVKCIHSGGRKRFTYDFNGFFMDVDIPFLRMYKKYIQSCYDNNIKPVENMTQSDDHLDLIYACVERQFIIDGHDWKLLQGRIGRSEGRGVQYPLEVFIGIADMHGFRSAKIMEYCQVETQDRFNNLLSSFEKNIKEGAATLSFKAKNRIYIKTKLVLNDMRGRLNKVYVDLADLNF